MNILFVTNMYPIAKPSYGIFVKEQIDEISKSTNCKYDLYFINSFKYGKIPYLLSMFGIPLKILKGKYDIVHIHYGLSALFLLLFRPSSSVYVTLHGSDILEKQGKRFQVYMTKKILKKVDKVFILSEEMEAIIKPLNVNYEIIPCGVNTELFKPTKPTLKKDNSKLVIFPGNPEMEVKNFPLFKKVIEYLNQNSGFKVEFEPIHNLSREGVRDLLNRGDCLLMTSISEGSPQVIKEALSCGLPVVSVPVGDVKFMIQNIPNCFTSDTYLVEEIARLVLDSFNGNSEAIRKAFIGKNIYDQQSVTSRIIKNYESGLLTSKSKYSDSITNSPAVILNAK